MKRQPLTSLLVVLLLMVMLMLLLRSTLKRGLKLLAELVGVVSDVDAAGGIFFNAYGPTPLGCWLPADTTYGSADCQQAPVIPLPPQAGLLQPLSPL